MRKIMLMIISLGCISMANAGQAPQPCGPAGQLADDFSANVGSDARCFELRMYTAEAAVNGEGGINDLHQRLRSTEPKWLLCGSDSMTQTLWYGCWLIVTVLIASKYGRDSRLTQPGLHLGKNTLSEFQSKPT